MTGGISAPGAGTDLGHSSESLGILATVSPGNSLISLFLLSLTSLYPSVLKLSQDVSLVSFRSCRALTYILGFVVHFKLILSMEQERVEVQFLILLINRI